MLKNLGFKMMGIAILLIITLVMHFCVTPAQANTEKKYKCLNPTSWLPEFKPKPLSPRLDALKGKTVVLSLSATFSSHPPYLALKDALEKLAPDTEFFYQSDEKIFPDDIDAVIIGHGH